MMMMILRLPTARRYVSHHSVTVLLRNTEKLRLQWWRSKYDTYRSFIHSFFILSSSFSLQWWRRRCWFHLTERNPESHHLHHPPILTWSLMNQRLTERERERERLTEREREREERLTEKREREERDWLRERGERERERETDWERERERERDWLREREEREGETDWDRERERGRGRKILLASQVRIFLMHHALVNHIDFK